MGHPNLLRQLRVIGRLLRLTAIGRGLSLWLVLSSCLLAGLSLAARLHASPYVLPVTAFLAIVGIVLFVAPAMLRPLPVGRIARLIEAHHPQLQETLLTAADLAQRRASYHSPQLTAALIAHAESVLPTLCLEPVLGLRRFRLLLPAAALALLVAGSLALLWRDSLVAMVRPVAGVTGPGPVTAKTAEPLAAPLLAGIRIRIQPPEYTGLPAQVVTENLQRLAALPGSTITLSALTPAAATLELLVGRDSCSLTSQPEGRQAYQFVLRSPVRWEFVAANASGRDRRSGWLTLRPDLPPTVRLTSPSRDVTLRNRRSLMLSVIASDDFGLESLALEYRVMGGRAWQRQELGASGRVTKLSYEWDLSPLNLRPREGVLVRFSAQDNSLPGGRTSYSQTRRITIADPRSREPTARLQEAQAEQGEALERLREEAREIQRELQEILERLRSGETRATDAATRAALERAADRLQRQAERLRQAVAEAEEELEKHPDAAPEAAGRIRELNELLRQTLEQQLPRAVEQLRQAARQASPEQMPRQIRQAEQMQRELLQQLEQLAALMKQAQLETALARLREEVQSLLERQQTLSQQTRQTQPADRERLAQQAAKQQELARDTAPLADRLDQLAQQSAVAPPVQKQLQQMARETRQADPSARMQQAAGELQQGQPQEAAQNQTAAEQALQQLAGQLAGAQASVYQQQRQELQQAAQQLTRDALYLSQQQERVQRDTRSLSGQMQQQVVQAKPRLQRLQQRQETVAAGIQGLQQRLQQLIQTTPLMDPQVAAEAQGLASEAAQAAREIGGGVPDQAVHTQGGVMAGLNRLVEQLMASQDALQQASAQMAWQETLKRLEQLAQQQQGVNQMTQQMGSSGQPLAKPGGPNLADMQAGIRQALQQMLGQQGEGSSLSQQLGGLPAQMDDVEQDLRGSQVTQQTQRTQAEILHKLLDAQRSLYRKDRQDRQRRAERPKPYPRPSSPPELRQPPRPPQRPPSAAPSQQQWPLGYEDLTRAYFEALARDWPSALAKPPDRNENTRTP